MVQKNRSLCGPEDLAVTGPGRSRNIPVWSATGGRASSAVNSSSRRSRTFSVRSATTSAAVEESGGEVTAAVKQIRQP